MNKFSTSLTKKAHTDNLSMWAFRVSSGMPYASRLVSSTEHHRHCPNGTIPWDNPGHMNGGLGTTRQNYSCPWLVRNSS
ncbi:hypothetical protein BCEP4_410056 [Burkholderia cepacia]|nr:hypothetical protein BCEP4_410056 [Burkholderia cepacia]